MSLELTRTLSEYKIKSNDFIDLVNTKGNIYLEGVPFYIDLSIGSIINSNRIYDINFNKPSLKFLIDSIFFFKKSLEILEIYDIYKIYRSFSRISLSNFFNTLNF